MSDCKKAASGGKRLDAATQRRRRVSGGFLSFHKMDELHKRRASQELSASWQALSTTLNRSTQKPRTRILRRNCLLLFLSFISLLAHHLLHELRVKTLEMIAIKPFAFTYRAMHASMLRRLIVRLQLCASGHVAIKLLFESLARI